MENFIFCAVSSRVIYLQSLWLYLMTTQADDQNLLKRTFANNAIIIRLLSVLDGAMQEVL